MLKHMVAMLPSLVSFNSVRLSRVMVLDMADLMRASLCILQTILMLIFIMVS